MKSIKKISLIVSFAVVFSFILYAWTIFSPTVDDYKVIHNRDTEFNLAFAFATALRINHPDAYDMIDPGLKPRLDEWMNSHQSQKCARLPYLFLGTQDIHHNYNITFGCSGANGSIGFEIDNIAIRNMKVIDWDIVKACTYC